MILIYSVIRELEIGTYALQLQTNRILQNQANQGQKDFSVTLVGSIYYLPEFPIIKPPLDADLTYLMIGSPGHNTNLVTGKSSFVFLLKSSFRILKTDQINLCF